MLKQILINLITIFIFTYSFSSLAEPTLPTGITELRIELDRINFDLKEDAQLERLKVMIAHTNALAEKNPQDPSYLMLAGFFNIQYASYVGGLGVIKYAKAARDYLEASIEIDPTIYGASAHAVLGQMYVSIPGWPLAFGDNKKGVKHFKKAIEIAPNSMDANFTYAGYLFEKKKYAQAKVFLEKAKIAPPRPNREKADIKIHKIIEDVLVEIEKKLS